VTESPLPTFAPGLDPGSSFVDLLRRVAPHDLPGAGLEGSGGAAPLDVTHGTTVLAIRYQNGVVALIEASPSGYHLRGTLQIPVVAP